MRIAGKLDLEIGTDAASQVLERELRLR